MAGIVLTKPTWFQTNGPIYIETKGVIFDGNPIQHLYITWTDITGVERVLRAGPSLGFDNYVAGDLLNSEIGNDLINSSDTRDNLSPEDRYR